MFVLHVNKSQLLFETLCVVKEITMNLVKVQELIGPILDWAVAKCEYDELAAAIIQFPANSKYYPKITPSTDWSQGGPIIEREGILLRAIRKEGHSLNNQWLAMYDNGNTGTFVHWVNKSAIASVYSSGPTPLVAAIRCYVASKMGYEIQTPKELIMYGHS